MWNEFTMVRFDKHEETWSETTGFYFKKSHDYKMAADDALIQNFLFYKVGTFFGIMGILWYLRDTVKYYTTKRIYAWVVNKIAIRMNKGFKKEKTELFEHMHQYKEKVQRDLTVLEVGAGSAANLKYFPYNTKLVCIDPNPHFKGYIINNIKKNDTVISVEIVHGYAEDMPLEDNHYDVVICTLVLCTVSDPVKSLQEVKRVLKPVRLIANLFLISLNSVV